MRTLHLGPEELLVAVKIGVAADGVGRGRRGHDRRAPRRRSASRADAQVIYIEPDIYAGARPGCAARAAGARRALSERDSGLRRAEVGRARSLGIQSAMRLSHEIVVRRSRTSLCADHLNPTQARTPRNGLQGC